MNLSREDFSREKFAYVTSIGILGVAILINATVLAYSLYQYLSFNVPFFWFEGYTLYFSQNPNMMFQPISEAPYLVTIYPPVYMLLTSALDLVIQQTFIAGRVISTLATFGTGVLLFLILRRTSTDSRVDYPILAGILFVSSSLILRWGFMARIDALALFFSLAAVYWFLRASGIQQFIGAIIFCALALFTKQTYFIAPLAILISYLERDQYDRGILFFAVLGIFGGGILFGLNTLTDGIAWQHMVTYNSVIAYEPFRMKVASMLLEFTKENVILGAVSIYAILAHYRDINTTILWFFIGSCFFVAFLPKIGSGTNMLIPLFTSLILVSGVTYDELVPEFSRITDSTKRNSLAFSITALLVAAQLLLFVSLPMSPVAGSNATATEISDSETPILGEVAGPPIMNQQTPAYQPLVMKGLSDAGVWDQSRLLDDIDRTRYDYIVVKFTIGDPSTYHLHTWNFWTDEMLSEIEENYCLSDKHGVYRIYEPRESNNCAYTSPS